MLPRAGTFFVGAERSLGILHKFQQNEQHLIGIGGKVDDTSVMIADFIERRTEEYKGRSGPQRRREEQRGLWACGDFECCGGVSDEEFDLNLPEPHSPLNTTPQPPSSNVRR
ncbi:unnamed protein product [Polarella glacialis]|uniref:Uncharacterized protein n=1 Tax=Polarella glacialis TaxID=89957 RepID=A0A813JJM2_POLGL|nr:unnamed protein product [Polarella glacialis]